MHVTCAASSVFPLGHRHGHLHVCHQSSLAAYAVASHSHQLIRQMLQIILEISNDSVYGLCTLIIIHNTFSSDAHFLWLLMQPPLNAYTTGQNSS